MEIKFERFSLDNGLRVLFHQDTSTPLVAINLLYDVGAKDEDRRQTGFAHLFEHLMFGGSVNIPSFDEPLQMAGGENNAYTTNDFTNYYIQIPKQNLETAFWLESDRMLSLAFDERSLDVQKKVVVEEFNEHYISRPYGEAWHDLRRLAYEKHPYKWMTIGDSPQHIEDATLEQVRCFFAKFYRPVNAILCVAGDLSLAEVKLLADKWFGPIPKGEAYNRNLPREPKQNQARHREKIMDVPVDALYKVWHIGPRLSDEYYAGDVLSEILGNGRSSRLYHQMVKEQQLFSAISCYHTGSLDPGLFVIEGRVAADKTIEEADRAIERELQALIETGLSSSEVEKAKNKVEAQIAFQDTGLLSRANNLAYFELLGDANLINKELERYQSIDKGTLQQVAENIFRKENSSTLYYRARTKSHGKG